MIDINWNPDKRQLRQFSAALMVATLVVGGLFWWKIGPNLGSKVLWAVGPLLAFLGLILPRAIRPVFLLLTLLAYPIGMVVGTVLLALVFYGIMMPIGLFFRITGRDVLSRKLDPEAETYWIARGGKTPPARYFKQF